MKRPPPLPDLDDTPEVLEGGHLWIQELIDGASLRFTVSEDGTLAFGNSRRPFDGDPPLSLRPAVRHVRESLDWATVYESDADPTGITFFGVAPRTEGIDYDWERIPPFLGTDVWTDDSEAFLPPDTVERVYDRIGFATVPAVRKEMPVRDFDPESYEMPDSTWRDGPAAGVVLRTKQGDRAKLPADAVETDTDGYEEIPTDPNALVDHFLTDNLLARVVDALETRGESPATEQVHERALETVARESYRELDRAGADLDTRAVRSAARERVRAWLDE